MERKWVGMKEYQFQLGGSGGVAEGDGEHISRITGVLEWFSQAETDGTGWTGLAGPIPKLF